ncbi:hypothetical protein GGF31_008352 [Allomyces arbusculus]|nr:hypothetical protein GGF31_008352 [Allomyces arbusculus]
MAKVISAEEKPILELIRSEGSCKIYSLKDIEAPASSLGGVGTHQKRAELNVLKAEVEQSKTQLDVLVRKLGLEQAANEGRDLDKQFETTLQRIQTCREANKRNVQNLRILQAFNCDKPGVAPASLCKRTGIPVNLSDME